MAERLQRSGVDFEAVPGLILALEAPVMSGIPMTIEGRESSVGFGLVKGAETVVLRLASGWWESGISALLADGRKASTHAALILNAGTPGQHRVGAPLGELARKAATYGLRGDALLVLGPGVDMAEQLDTLAQRPLHGRRILITRAQHQVDPLRRELVDMGAAVVEIPTIEVRALPTDERVRKTIAALEPGLAQVVQRRRRRRYHVHQLFDGGQFRACVSGRQAAGDPWRRRGGLHGSGDGGHGTQARPPCRYRRSRVHDPRHGPGDR